MKVVTDHGNDEFGDFKLILLGMLDTYGYEKTILAIAKHLIEQDLCNTTHELYRRSSKGVRTNLFSCGLCRTPFSSDSSDGSNAMVVFFCTHGFHRRCLGERNTNCPLCTNRAKEKLPATKKK